MGHTAMKGRNVNSGQEMPAEFYDRAVVEKLLAACGHGWHGARNRALIGILYHSGLRVSEALALNTYDIVRDDRGAARINVRRGKGGKSRVAVLRPDGVSLLDEYLKIRGDHPGLLFHSYDGKQLKSAAVRMLLPRLARKAGAGQRVHAHGLRHTHAVELMDAGVPTPYIQRQLGHSSLQITERYLNHVSPDALVDAVLAASQKEDK